MLDTYKESISKIELSGPTVFDEVINKVISFCDKYTGNFYHVLLILTDGRIHNMRKTIDAIYKASDKPISIVIIGIGEGDRDDFRNMDTLDADDYPLINSKG